MTVDRIKYGKSFQTGIAQWERIDLEASVDEIDNRFTCYQQLHDELDMVHRKLNPHLYPKGNEPIVSSFDEVPVRQVEKEDPTQRMIRAINECSEVKVLESFKLLASKNPIIQEAYDKKLKALQ